MGLYAEVWFISEDLEQSVEKRHLGLFIVHSKHLKNLYSVQALFLSVKV